MVGHTVIAWMLLRQAAAAAVKSASSDANQAFCEGKLMSCQYFFRMELPKIKVCAA